MTTVQAGSPRTNLEATVKNAIGREPDRAMGYMNPVGEKNKSASEGTGYIATMKLSVGRVEVGGLDEGTESIVSYDRCETADANIGQINMGTASSFCGINGALWGYDLATVDNDPLSPFKSSELFDSSELSILTESTRNHIKNKEFKIFSAGPLLNATEHLFGHVDKWRHPPLPGAHIICANKNATSRGPAYAWAFIAIAIAKDRNMNSDLFIEDCGTFKAQEIIAGGKKVVIPNHDQVIELLKDHRQAVLKSIVLCGQDYRSASYEEVFICGKAIYAGPNEVACALACAPYILLAQNDVPTKKPEDLIKMKLVEWDKAVWPNQPITPVDWKDKDGIIVEAPQR